MKIGEVIDFLIVVVLAMATQSDGVLFVPKER
jgi:hypothetical protein